MRFTQVLAMALALSVGVAMAEGQKHKGMGQGAQKGHQAAMRHANPMPNLMKVVKKHGEELNLSEVQAKELSVWRERHMQPMHGKIEQIAEMENALNAGALAGKSKAELMGMSSRILQARADIVSTKIDCRDNLQRVLSPEQYQQVLAIYQKMH